MAKKQEKLKPNIYIGPKPFDKTNWAQCNGLDVFMLLQTGESISSISEKFNIPAKAVLYKLRRG